MSDRRARMRILAVALLVALGLVPLAREGASAMGWYRGVSGSRFQVAVPRPDCDPANPEVRILDRPEELDALNDPGARIFCLKPGDYTRYGRVELETSGSWGERRHLRYYDPAAPDARVHPVDQDPGARAVLERLVLDRADHWVIQGVTIDGGPGSRKSLLLGARYNILHRLLVQHGQGPLVYLMEKEGRPSSHNVLQRSVLRRSDLSSSDQICLGIRAAPSGRPMRGNAIVDNEIYDCTQAIQLVCCTGEDGAEERPGPLPDTVVAGNDLYISPARYSDGRGRRTPDGAYACAESALAIKKGGTREEPVRVIGNRLWGTRKTDPHCGGSGSHGPLVVQLGRAEHVFYEGNVLLDAPIGMIVAGGGRATILRNTMHDMHQEAPEGQRAVALRLSKDSSRSEAYFNILSDADDEGCKTRSDRSTFQCNVLANADARASSESERFVADYNAYYGSERLAKPGRHDIVGTVESSGLRSRCIRRKRLTEPEWVCLPHARTTVASPHAGACGAAAFRCEAFDGDPSATRCAGPDDAAACEGVGTARCRAYPADWFR